VLKALPDDKDTTIAKKVANSKIFLIYANYSNITTPLFTGMVLERLMSNHPSFHSKGYLNSYSAE